MAGWHYAIVKKKCDDLLGGFEYYYQVHEYYPPEDGDGVGGWTVDPITPMGHTIMELEWELEAMLKDVRKRRRIIDESLEDAKKTPPPTPG